jgi:hypothetical protein
MANSKHGRKIVNWEKQIIEFGQSLLEASVCYVPTDQIFRSTDSDDRTGDQGGDRLPRPGPAIKAEREVLGSGDREQR